jgi:hypothetical protein
VLNEFFPDRIKDFKLQTILDLSEEVNIVYPLKNLCVIVNNPTSIKRNDANNLHNTAGPALVFGETYKIYCLNGIRMTEEQVMTPASEMSMTDIMKEPNVDIRRELLRKVGLERFLDYTQSREVDRMVVKYNNKEIEYLLLDIVLQHEGGTTTTARVLKMDNPSINAVHVEGVEEDCKTVKEAIAWRMGLDEYVEPEQLT